MDLINENIWYVAESEDEILQIPSPWLTMTLQARLAWGASTNCLRPELTDGPTGQGPRTVNFSKNLRTSRNFQQLQLFSIKSTTRWNYWDECHVEMVIRPGSLNFYFSIGSAAGLRGDVCLLYTDYIACFCDTIFVRYNVFIMFPWFKNEYYTLNWSTKVNFLVWKSASFATKISVY